MAHLFFVSYSRNNTNDPNDAEMIRKLVSDLKSDLDQQNLAAASDEVCFFDTTNIETGADWNDELSEAAAQSRIAVSLFSPSFFSSVWCGREFQVFLDRQKLLPLKPGERAPKSVIPILWMRPPGIPEAASAFQYVDDSLPHAPFPSEYVQIGLRQIMRLNNGSQYAQVRFALGERIFKAVTSTQLPQLANLDLRRYRSAWEGPTPREAESFGSNSVNKTCFVYLANAGWHWRPYAEPEPKVGAMAQQITGEAGLQYEEIPYNLDLQAKLRETNKHHIPTVLICDPSSWNNPVIQKAMEEYDDRYYLNCGLIVPWDVASPANDGRWHQLSQGFPQKTKVPPLNHEWTSVSTPGTLRTKTLATIEEIRGRVLNELASSGAPIAKAENEEVAEASQAHGINLQNAPVIANVSHTEVR